MMSLASPSVALLCVAISACSASHAASIAEQERPDASSNLPTADSGTKATPDAAAAVQSADDAQVRECWITEPCPKLWTPTQAEVQTPYGIWKIASSSMGYVSGLSVYTGLSLFGELNGGPAVLHIALADITEQGAYKAQATPGTYLTVEEGAAPVLPRRRLTMHFDTCAPDDPDHGLSGSLVVRVHEAPTRTDQPVKVTFEGSIKLTEPGWSLDLPISIGQSCGSIIYD